MGFLVDRKSDAQFFLDFLDLHAQRGLRDKALFCCEGKVSMFGDRQNIL
jgi:hypothetical protein